MIENMVESFNQLRREIACEVKMNFIRLILEPTLT